jgi:thiamine pyrophosphokinase
MEALTYKTPHCIIALHGTLPDRSWFDAHAALPVYSADGAALTLLSMNIRSQAVIGDLDSLMSEIEESGPDLDNRMFKHIEHDTNQATTDFEKVLEYVYGCGHRYCLIVGFHGGELDHTLNNMSILMRYGKRMNLCVYESGMMALPLYEREEAYRWSVSPGAMISLVPQPMARVTATGVEWTLTNERLALGVREGARNRATEWECRLEIHEGALLLFVPAVRMQIPITHS